MEGHVTFAKASSIKVGDHMCISNFPCKITHVDISKPGKHGSSKMHFTGIDVITNKKHDYITPSSKDVSVPVITKKEYVLMDLMEEEDNNESVTYCSLMNQGKTFDHIKLPNNELGKSIKDTFDNNNQGDDILINVMEVMEQEIIVAFKLAKA